MIKRRMAFVCFAAMVALVVNVPAFGQGAATSSISGSVLDSAGGAIPGATVQVKNESGVSLETVSSSEGVFTIPAVRAGKYTLSVSLSGFKTYSTTVDVLPGVVTSVKAVLEVGQISETVTVSGSGELINTQSATVSATLNTDQLNRMPTPTRNALNALTFLPGVNTATTNRNSNVNGLPDSFMNITLDGVSNNDQFLRSSDGFFASVTPRQDAVQAVTVTMAAGTAQSGGSGAVNINFETRSGTNNYSGSAYTVYRDPALNTNYWFNERDGLPKNDVKLYTHGARLGGPISIPGWFDGRNKAFFFAHYEQIRFPNSFSRDRTVLHPDAVNGVFRYNVGGATREVNVLNLAAQNGHVATIDPTVAALLANIQSAMQTTGAITQNSDPLLQTYSWLSPGKLFEHQPTLRLDYNVADNHRLSGSAQYIYAERDPDYLNAVDARFPGAPNYRFFHSTRPLYSLALRSTLSPNIVSELTGGVTKGGASYFGDDSSNGIQTFADQGGYAIDFDSNIGLTNWFATNGPSWRSSWTYSIGETLNWQKGSHAMSFGGSLLFVRAWERAKQVVPGIQLGFNNTNDPAAGLFTTANFPNATAAQLTDARELYGLLTGRVTSITGQAALDPSTGTYIPFAPRTREGKMDVHSLFFQDAWRVTPTLTVNAGLRWDLQLPFTPVNDVMTTVSMADVCGISGPGDGSTYNKCNFFAPGSSGGRATPEFVPLTAGTRGYETDWNNFGPSLGVAWRPNVQSGFLRTILGDPDQATLRAGYSRAYARQGMSDFTGVYGPNPGSTLSLTRNEATGLVPAGESWPVLLSQPSRLGNADFPERPTYPIVARANRADDLEAFAPDIKIPSAHTWTVSFQRALSRDMAVDIRYVGTKGVDQWSRLDYNADRTLLENGFLDEFQRAMANLQANNLAGGNRAGSFAYFGPGTGTNPLPIYLAYLNGRTNASDPGAYTGGSNTWTNSTLAQRLAPSNPLPGTSASDLDGNLTRRNNALAAGLAPNFFVVNPALDNNWVTDSGAFSDNHALQLEVRRRMSKGLQANINYQYAVEGGSSFLGWRYGRVMTPTENVRHAFKTQWDWILPVGRGQRFGSGMNGLLDAVLGGWSFNGVGRVQARSIDFGNVRLVGMTLDDLQDIYKHYLRPNESGVLTVYMLPQDVIDNTRRAFNVSTSSPTGYSSLGVPEGRYFAPANSADCLQLKEGDCAPIDTMVIAPWFTRFDVGVTKRFPIRGAMNFEVRLDVLNVFDNVNFNLYEPANNNASFASAAFGQVTSAYTDASNQYDPGGRIGQLMFRFNW